MLVLAGLLVTKEESSLHKSREIKQHKEDKWPKRPFGSKVKWYCAISENINDKTLEVHYKHLSDIKQKNVMEIKEEMLRVLCAQSFKFVKLTEFIHAIVLEPPSFHFSPLAWEKKKKTSSVNEKKTKK